MNTKKEKIDVSFIEFIDNIECLKLIEASPLGILKMLDEEVTIPKGGDKSLITKMHKKFAEEDKHPFYGLIRKQPEVFIIKHYAGAVVYDSTGFVNKNRDKLHDSLTDLVQQSEVPLVRGIFLIESASDDKNAAATKAPPAGKTAAPAGKAGAAGGGAKERRAKAAAKKGATGTISGKVQKGGSRTLCAQFSSQLKQLYDTLTAANPHYIRCVKPNAQKKCGDFSSKMVLRQMQYAGLFEAIRIRRAGFPFRVPHGEFVSRYRVCLDAAQLRTIRDILSPFKDQKERDDQGKAADSKAAAFVLSTFSKHLDAKEYQMGLTKVFMRNSQRLILTRLRDQALTVCVLKIQAYQRGNNARRFYIKVKAFQEKVKKVLTERNMETLKATLQEAGEQGIDIFILVRVSDLLTYLEEEKRVANILEEGCKENELEPINAGLEQVGLMKTKFPGEAPSDYYLKIISQAESQKQALIRKDKARKQLAQAFQNEDIKELQDAIKEAADAGLKPEEYAEAQKLLERLEFEEKCIQELSKAVESGDLVDIEAKLGPAEGVTLDGKRKEIIANAKESLKKGYFEKLKAKMIAAKEDSKNHLPGHESDTPVDQLPIPPEEKAIVEEFIPKLEALKYHDLAAMAKSFLAEQVTQRGLAQKEAFFTYLQATVKEAEEDSKNHQPNHEVDTPAVELPLPPVEQKIKDVILPKLEKLRYEEFALEAKTVLDRLLNLRIQGLKAAHHDYLQSTLKVAEAETKSHLPNHEVDTPAASLPLPPAEKLIKESILPKLTKLGYHEFVETATTFLAAQLSNRDVALKEIHHDYLQSIIREADAESAKYMPTEENDKPAAELPPSEKKIKEEILPKLVKLGYLDFVQTANAFLEAQQAKREAESLRIIQEKTDKIRMAKEAEERKKREEERKKREEEERARLAEEQRKEEERLAKEGKKISDLEKQRRDDENKKLQAKIEQERREEEERAKAEALAHEKELQKARDEAERKRVEAEAKLVEQQKKQEAAYLSEKAGNESNQAVLAQKLDEQRKKQEEEYQREKEAQEKRSAELAEAERAAALKASEAAKARARHYHPAPAGPPGPGGHPPPPPDDDFNMPPPPPPEEMELPPPPPPEDDGSEKREEELNAAIKARSLSLITTLLSTAESLGDKTRTVRIARNLKDVLTEERKILNQLKQCLKDLNVNPLKSLLREAANLGLDNPIISEARHLCYGMSKSELLTKRITLALKNKEPEKLSALLDEAKEDGIENEEVEHARDFVAMTLELGDWNSKMRVNRTKSVSGITSSQTAAYKNFLETKGSFPLRRFTNLRKEGNYAKRKYFAKKGLKKKRLIWQKDDIPRSLVKLSTAHCGGVKKSKLVKKIARQIFKNIRGYMGDHYHAYPVTLAYEVVNTGVNEELLRDEIFCQLIKQTTKNPSLDSRLLGWKLLYLCVSTFWPSGELKPILISHLAAHAPPKIHQKEFGFNVISDLAYHCYIALDDKSPPAGEPPSMQDIEKITNGTLGAVKSFFSVEAGDELDEKGEPVTETVEEGEGDTGATPVGGDPHPPTDLLKMASPPPPPRPSKSVAVPVATEPHPPPLEDGPPPVDAEVPADLADTYGSKKFHRPGES